MLDTSKKLLLEGPGAPRPPSPRSVPILASHASHQLESIFQDDRALIYSSTAKVVRTLDALRALGVDRLRITVLRSAIAPAAGSRIAPAGFDASDPAAYPRGARAPYDRVLGLARAGSMSTSTSRPRAAVGHAPWRSTGPRD